MTDLGKLDHERLLNQFRAVGTEYAAALDVKATLAELRAELLHRITLSEGTKKGEDLSKYSRADLEKYHRWTLESLQAFRDRFGVRSNCAALDAIDQMKAQLTLFSSIQSALEKDAQQWRSGAIQLKLQGELLESLAPHLKDCEGGCPHCHDLLDKYDAAVYTAQSKGINPEESTTNGAE